MIDDTLRCIRESMMTLLDEKEYSTIQMKEIAQRANIGRRTLYRYFENKNQVLKYIAESLINRFAEEIKRQEKLTLQSVTYAFYVFIEKNRSEFILFKKAGLLNYLEEEIPKLIIGVAAKTKYKDKEPAELQQLQSNLPIIDKYARCYTIAGYWHIAMLWMEENNPSSPEEMTEITLKIMRGEN